MRNQPRLPFLIAVACWTILLYMCFFRKTDNPGEQPLIRIHSKLYNKEYCVAYDFLVAEKKFRDDGLEPVTLTIHGTPDKLKSIESKPRNWDGPISLGFFIDFHSKDSLTHFAELHRCDGEFRDKVSVHIVFRLASPHTECPAIEISPSDKPCTEILNSQDSFPQSTATSQKLYPINLMRNIARKGAKSDLHFLSDSDVSMSAGFVEKVKPVANEMIDGKNKKMLVVRKFQTDNKILPRDHVELQRDLNSYRVFEYDHKDSYAGKSAPNTSDWLYSSSISNLIVSWEIPYGGHQWEVQGILHRNDLHNEDYFKSKSCDMQTLIYSLCRANYTFHLLSHVFNIHEGFETNTIFSKIDTNNNKSYCRRNYNNFNREMHAKFPDTLDKCGAFNR